MNEALKSLSNISPLQTYLYRHDEIQTRRPFGCDVDENDWLWQGCGNNRLTGHNLRTAEVLQIPLPEMGNRSIFQVFSSQGKLVLTLGTCPYYLVYDVAKRKCIRKEIVGSNPTVWYGTKIPNGKILLYQRSESKILVLDSPESSARIIACPFSGQLSTGKYIKGLVYSTLYDPARLIRFDPIKEKFLDEIPFPYPEANPAAGNELEEIIFFSDTAGGRFIPFDIQTNNFLDTIQTPDYGTLYGYLAPVFSFQGKGYFSLSTYRHSSRMDPKTGKIIIPEGKLSVDNFPIRFLDRYLVFDPKTNGFEYLIVPPQPDGIPLVCYPWTDGNRFAMAGFVIPFGKPGELAKSLDPKVGAWYGSWIILQNFPALESPAFPPYDLQFDIKEHRAKYRHSYNRSLYLPHEPYTPTITNMEGPATQYLPGKEQELVRRAERTDSKAYFYDLAETITRDVQTDSEKVQRIARFIKRSLHYNPIQALSNDNPIAALESHDVRCGQGVQITLALLNAIDIPAKAIKLSNHVVAEATYDGSDHIVDALFFGGDQPHRDGYVLSVDELREDPYFADAFPQDCFAYDPELVQSQDGFWVQGYVFGIWGSEPYYSYYLGAKKEHPPTLPLALPAQRVDEDQVRLNWARSLKHGEAKIEYDIQIFSERDCENRIFHSNTEETFLIFRVPEKNRMYFVELRAKDDHRGKNPLTWYPAVRSNFVLVPKEQYGWYGIL